LSTGAFQLGARIEEWLDSGEVVTLTLVRGELLSIDPETTGGVARPP
jgi:hypothetical protein